jgi:hypothetical protein
LVFGSRSRERVADQVSAARGVSVPYKRGDELASAGIVCEHPPPTQFGGDN